MRKNGIFVNVVNGGRLNLKASIEDQTMGLCIDEDLQPYRLLVSGNSGCNRFMKGEPARAEGSSSQPPSAKPQR